MPSFTDAQIETLKQFCRRHVIAQFCRERKHVIAQFCEDHVFKIKTSLDHAQGDQGQPQCGQYECLAGDADTRPGLFVAPIIMHRDPGQEGREILLTSPEDRAQLPSPLTVAALTDAFLANVAKKRGGIARL
jgi:hypothetical protein